MNKLSFLFFTREHITGLVLRVTLAIVLLPHGSQLLLGWFGGYGFSASMNYFTQVEGLPWFIAFAVILLQSFGTLLILLGYMGRFFSLSIIILFIGMIVTSHWQHGFFMNWMGSQNGEGFEFHILIIGMALALMLNGSGTFSIDAWLTKNRKRRALDY